MGEISNEKNCMAKSIDTSRGKELTALNLAPVLIVFLRNVTE